MKFGHTDAEIVAMMDAETWISGADAADALAGAVPQVGDALARADGSRWQVKSAALALGLWHIAAREVR